MATVISFDLDNGAAGLDEAVSYTEGDGAIRLAPNVSLTANPGDNFASQTLTLSGLLVGDQIGYAGGVSVSGSSIKIGGKIIATFTGGTGGTDLVFTFTSNATAIRVQALIGSLTLLNTSDNPTVNHSITFDLVGITRTDVVTVTPVNDAPVLTAGGILSYTENQSTTAINTGLSITDADSPNLTGATVSITTNFASGQDVLGFVSQAGITGSYNSTTGVLTLTGSSSVANYQAALRSVTYLNTSENPSTATRTISFQVNDAATSNNTSSLASTSVTIARVNDAPAVDLNGAAGGTSAELTYNIADPFTKIAPSGTVVDVDSPDFNGGSLRVTLTANGTATDQLVIMTDGTVTLSGAGGTTIKINNTSIGTFSGGVNGAPLVVTFNNGATPARVQTLLEHIGYSNSSGNPSTSPRTVTFTINDGDGTASGGQNTGSATAMITYGSSNTSPVVASASLTVSEGGTATLSAANFGITDPDDSSFTYTVSAVTGGYFQLSSAAAVPITSFSSADLAGGVVQFVDDGNEAAPSFSVKVNDGDVDSNTLAATINYIPVNDVPVAAPVVLAAIAEDSGARLITQAELLVGSSDIDSAVLTVTALSINSGDGTLVDIGNGAWSYTPSADDDTSVTFNHTVSDGALDDSSTVSLDITPVNDAPVNAMPDGYDTSEDMSFRLSGLTVTDVDAGSAIITETLSVTSGTLTASSAFGVTVTGSGTSSVVLSGTQAALNSYIGLSVGPTYVPVANANGTVQVTMTTNDGGNSGTGGLLSDTDTVNIVITPINDGPIVQNPITDRATSEDSGGVVYFGFAEDTFADVDGNTLTYSATLADGSALPSWLNFDAPNLWFFGTPPQNFNGILSIKVTASDASLSVADTFDFTVTPVNDAPVNAMPGGYATSEDTSLRLSGLTVTDVDAASSIITETLSVTSGTLTASSAFGVTVTGSGTSSVVLSGTQAALNSYIGLSVGPTYVPVANANGTVQVTMTTNDGGNSGTGGLLSDTDTVNIVITPINDGPIVQNPITDRATSEDSGGVVYFGFAEDTFADVDGNTLTYSATLADGSALPSWLNFDAPNLWFFGTPPQNFNGILSIKVTASDASLSVADTFDFTVTPVNDAPVVASASLTVSEGQTATLSAANFGITDPDDSSFTYTVSAVTGGYFQLSGAASVSITSFSSANLTGGLVQFVDDGDEAAPSFSVQVNDGDVDSNTLAATINYTAVNDTPVVASASLTVSEGQTATLSAANFGITDPDDSSFTYTVSAVTGGYFQLSSAAGVSITSFSSANLTGGLVQFVDDGDETEPSFSVKVNDGDADSGTLAATINYTPVNDTPTLTTMVATADTVAEDAQVAITFAEIAAQGNEADVDGTVVAFVVKAVSSGTLLIGTSAGTATPWAVGTNDTVNSTNSAFWTGALNANGTLNAFTVVAKDNGALESPNAVQVQVNVTAVNDAPTNFLLSSDQVPENIPGATIGVLSAGDPEGGTVSFAIQPGPDSSLFTIAGNQLRVGNSGLDFESSPTRAVTVRASDSNGGFVDQTFTIHVLDSDEVSLTIGQDTILPSSSDTQIAASSVTLNATDNLDGGAGADSLVLYNAGNFDLNSLAGYTGIEEQRLVNFATGVATLYLKYGTTTSVVAIGTGNTQIVLGGTAAATTIQGGDGDDTVRLLGTGTAASFLGGNGSDDLIVFTAVAWNSSIVFDGGAGGLDRLQFLAANATFDLQLATIANVERIYDGAGNITLLVDADALTNFASLDGINTSKIITGESSLNLSGKTVSGFTIQTTNATGTTFVVSNSATAFQIFGGPGSDTLQTSTFAFTPAQRDAIFATTSIEVITDTSGTYLAPAPEPSIYKLTAGTDVLAADANSNTINASSVTLNATDNLDGGAGADSLVLYNAGNFDLNSLAGYTGIEEQRLVNFATGVATLYLKYGTTTSVVASGTGNTQIVLGGTAAATTIQGGDGDDTVRLLGTGTAASFLGGNGTDDLIVFTAVAWNSSIVFDGGAGGLDRLQFLAANATFDLQLATIANVERIYDGAGNITLLVDADALTNFASLDGINTSKIITGESSLNLSGKTVSGFTIQTTNATGTTFVVSNSATAFQIFGGPGSDTLQTSTFAFTPAQRDAIFATTSIEVITDTSGTYLAPAPEPSIYKLTAGTDVLAADANSNTINASSVTLNATDNLDGGAGADSLVLYNAGNFDLNSLAGYTGIEEQRLVNFATGVATLYLKYGTTTSVVASGTGNTQIVLGGTAAATTIQGGDGDDTVRLLGTGTAASFLGGNGTDDLIVFTAVAWNSSIVFDGGAGGLDRLQFLAANATFDLQLATIANVERIYDGAGNITLLVDADALTNFASLDGINTSKIITGESSLNLSGKTVSGFTIQTTNATGTTFVVSNSATAFQIFGGPGSDTLQTSTFAFTPAQRDAIFATTSIEVIRDTTGFYGDETSNTIIGTAAADNIQAGGGADRLIGAGGADAQAGGSGSDTFVFNLPSEGMDTIGDFVSGNDFLEISATGFGNGLTAGGTVTLVSNADVASAFNAGPDGYFIFDNDGTNAGMVYWDANGGSGSDAVAIVQLIGVTSLSSSDFFLA